MHPCRSLQVRQSTGRGKCVEQPLLEFFASPNPNQRRTLGVDAKLDIVHIM